jgi:alpha-D-xyloside xylohydrolase
LDIADQYMFGPALLVCPVFEFNATSRQVHLPKGGVWYDLYAGQQLDGGKDIDAAAPLQRMPLFIRAGSIVPTGPDIQYASQKSDPIILYVYAGRDGAFNFYDDNGLDYRYEQNEFSIIPLSYRDADRTLTIGHRYGGFEGMQEQRTFYVAFVSAEAPRAMDFTTRGLLRVDYKGEEIVLQLK